MRTLGSFLLAVSLLASFANECRAQAGRFVPRFRPPPVPPAPAGPHIVPVHVGPHARGDGDAARPWVIGGITVLVIIVVAFFVWRRRASQARPQFAAAAASVVPPDDRVRGVDEVAEKAERTERLLQWVGQREATLSPEFLRNWVTKVFFVVQRSWQDRNYDPLHDLLAPELAARHRELLQQMRAGGEVNHIDDLRIDRLEFVHVRCPDTAEDREFTALITFEAKVYFVEERSGRFTRGSHEPRLYQEFWTFRWQQDSWRLLQIDMSHDAGALYADNEVEGMTAEQLQSC
jgi:predicted lipid-binding transport protein (Tim44 family)